MPKLKPDAVFLPRFLCERSIRSNLQALFVSLIGAGENCRTLTAFRPLGERADQASGNDLVKRCFRFAVRWLVRSYEFSLSDEVYLSQILDPARSPARFLSEIRKFPKRTTTLPCYLVSKSSSHFDRYYGESVSTLTVIIPMIQSVATIRCQSEISENMSFGQYELSGIQPLPFVNRIHPLSIRECLISTDAGKNLSLEELDFLKVSTNDAMNLSRSLALENFCEFQSFQSGRRHLGFPCVMVGKIVSLRTPRMTLQSVSSPQLVIDLILTPTLLSHLAIEASELSSVLGSCVRVFLIVWYRCHSHQNMPAEPEVLMMESAKGDRELWVDELTGYVRLRGKVEVNALKSRFPTELVMSPPECLQRDSDCVSWRSFTPKIDGIVNEFTVQRDLIRSRRAMRLLNTYPIALRDIFDMSKLRMATLGERISRDDDLLQVFLGLLNRRDWAGSLSLKLQLDEFPDIDSYVVEEKLHWLKDIGLIAREKGDTLNVTKAGTDVLYFATKKSVEPVLKEAIFRQNALSLPRLSKLAGVPPSLSLMILKEMERRGEVQCLEVQGRRCDLFWLNPDVDRSAIDACDESLESDFSKIMKVMISVHHPLGITKVQERLREMGLLNLDLLDLRLMLEELKAQGRITAEQEGLWLYEWADRMRDILSNNRDDAYTVDQLIEKANLPPANKVEVLAKLQSLLDRSQATEIFQSRWTYPSKTDYEVREKIARILKKDLQSFILDTMRQNAGALLEERLSFLGRTFLIREITRARFFPRPTYEIFRETIDTMRSSGQIRIHDGVVELVK